MQGMKEHPDKHFDLAIVDPLYGIGESGGKHIEWKTRPNSKGAKAKHKKKEWDDLRPDMKYFSELMRVSKCQIIWGGNYFADLLPVSGAWAVWDKLIEVSFFTTCELAWCSPKNNQINRFICHPFNNLNGGKDKIHPTQKPVALYIWLLKNYAKPGDLILDTHVGSASSLIACEKMGFDYVGYEIDTDYYNAAQQRLKEFRMQTDLFRD